MSSVRMKRVVIVCAVVLAAVPVVYFAYRRVSWVQQDLAVLTRFSNTESYEKLFNRVRSAKAAKEGFSFVVLGDTRSFYLRALNVLSQAAKDRPAFILSNGDIVRRGLVDEYVDHHMKLVAEIAPIPFIPIPGNHEAGPNKDFAAFKSIYGDVRFSFEYGNCRFIGINNGDFNTMGNDDLAFIESELEKSNADHRIIIFHVPPEFLESAVESEGSRGFSWNANAFHQLMLKYNVDHVFAGHVHGFATEKIDGVQYTITGGGGANLTDALGEEGRVYNYVRVSVTSEGVRNEVVKFVGGEWLRQAFPAKEQAIDDAN